MNAIWNDRPLSLNKQRCKEHRQTWQHSKTKKEYFKLLRKNSNTKSIPNINRIKNNHGVNKIHLLWNNILKLLTSTAGNRVFLASCADECLESHTPGDKRVEYYNFKPTLVT